MSDDTSTRRGFLKAAGAGTLALALGDSLDLHSQTPRQPRELTLYVGTYTSGKSEGIYVYRMNTASGKLRHHATAKGVVNPSYLAVDARGRYLYAVNETEEFEGQRGGALSAFSIERESGELRLLNQQPTHGGAPCYVTVDKAGRFALVANYTGGNVSVLPIGRDGRLGAATDTVQHHGSSVNAERQEGPHAHSIVLDAANRYAFAADLGTDKLMSYRFDARAGKLSPNVEPWFAAKPGAGPRHFTFHPDGKHAYLINELDSTLTAFAYTRSSGKLRAIQTVPTLPENFSGENTCADVHVSASGRFLYGSNRGHDSIVVFRIEPGTGKLAYVEHVHTQGRTPRNFVLDPTGRFLLVANQNTDSIVVFSADPATGRLKPTKHKIEVPAPVCLKFLNATP